MTVTVARSAGFCMGVARAVNMVYQEMQCKDLVTYGSLVHNRTVTDDLSRQGVRIIHDLSEAGGATVVIRSHGVPPSVEEFMRQNGIPYLDCTCRCVKAVHRYAEQSREEGRTLIVAGEASHPEIVGTVGYAGPGCIIIGDENDIPTDGLKAEASYTLVSQTTFERERFERIADTLLQLRPDTRIHDTICDATAKRQSEAAALAKTCDIMIVLGDESSANATKLYKICKKHCDRAVMVPSIHHLQLQILHSDDKIGITAGASTPPAITKEAIQYMNEIANNVNEQPEQAVPVQPEAQQESAVEAQSAPENESEAKSTQSFEEMLNESFVTLHTGDVVRGTVIQVTNNEVTVNLGYKSDGIITRAEMTDDPSADIMEMVKQGDMIDVYVLRVNDGDGNVLVSKKRLDAQANYKVIEQAFIDKAPLPGKVVDVVKGGLIALIHGSRVFVPSSQISNRYVEDLTVFKGREFNFSILEFDRTKRRIVAGRKELAAIEQQQRREELYNTLEIGQRIDGTVSRIVDFGAFVDLGGVDGLVHISELAWRRVRKVTDVLQVGDQVTVTVIDVNPDKNKISLSLKDIGNNPWNGVADKYPVGSIVEGKVVRMASFGAFVTLEDGVDGLVHISQIANRHVAKPEDELTVGQLIQVKVTDIDEANKKISLSKREADAALDVYDDDGYEDAEYADAADENAAANDSAE